MADTTGIIYVDDQPYPVDLDAVTGEQEFVLRRDLGVSLPEVAAAVDTGQVGVLELVALMMVSLMQSDEPADCRWLLRHTQANAAVVATGFGLPAPQPA